MVTNTNISKVEDKKTMIDITKDIENFKLYLDSNSRCVFSAKFGNGKSYFINEFIQKYKDGYLFIPIYPVNYQVMDNKDIFELIKRDILIKLLSDKQIKIEDIDFSASFLCYSFFTNNSRDIFTDLLNIIPTINLYGIELNIGSIIKNINKIKDRFTKHKEEIELSQNKLSEKYITQFNTSAGSIYEFDAISQLICSIIKKYQEENASKKVVLIIEDLDRIDPAHIFRILNVFSAHLDRHSSGIDETNMTNRKNKFNFDKIITVCDIENIKNIYKHVYGEKTDFSGYISKFSISKPFYYSLKDRLEDYIINHLLDKQLQNYPNTCKTLASQIISQMDKKQNFECNLRTIINRIINANSITKSKTTTLTIKKLSESIKLSSSSPFTYLLAMLKSFDIDLKDIIGSFPDNKEIINIVGKFWILLPIYSTTTTIEPCPTRQSMNPFIDNSKTNSSIRALEIRIAPRKTMPNVFVPYQLDAIFHQDEITEVEWLYSNDKEHLENLMKLHIYSIADFVTETFIMP